MVWYGMVWYGLAWHSLVCYDRYGIVYKVWMVWLNVCYKDKDKIKIKKPYLTSLIM